MVSVSKKSIKSIEAKWDRKLEEMRIKADFKFNILLQNRKKKLDREYEWEIEKNNKKKLAYIRKKEDEYRKKRLNEIREFEGKPKYEYKTEGPKIKLLPFALDLAQENAKLRDTDADGRGRCISCGKLCDWGGLAGGHRYSRRFTNMCLEKENINAQCHNCNWITGPKGDNVQKIQTNDQYDINLDKKFGEGTAKKLKLLVREFTQSKSEKYDLREKIDELIEENEELWKQKSFFTPKKKWRKTRDEYVKRHY